MFNKLKNIKEIKNLSGTKVLVRADFNVPIKNGVVIDDFRIKNTLPTINYLLNQGAKVILISHIESNSKDTTDSKLSLKPVADYLLQNGIPVSFLSNIRNAYSFIEGTLRSGEAILLENLREWDGEKNNDTKFAKELATLADVYVNEAFPVSHREHASIVGLPKLMPSYIGFQFQKEIDNLSKAFTPEHPFLFILGGAKFETKMPLVTKFLSIADKLFIGGALANDLLKAKGFEVGQSVVSKDKFDFTEILNSQKIIVPLDIVDEYKNTCNINECKISSKILDSGKNTLVEIDKYAQKSKFILWNGPLGLYEKGYKEGTLELAKIIARATKGGAVTILGGGDTVGAIAELGIENDFTFVSTGGGAMLDFLAQGTLVGIEAIKNNTVLDF